MPLINASDLPTGPGDIVIVPPDTPHKFTNNGPGRAHLVCLPREPHVRDGMAGMSAAATTEPCACGAPQKSATHRSPSRS